MRKFVPPPFFVFSVLSYVVSIVFLTLLRVVFVCSTPAFLHAIPPVEQQQLLGWAFFMGWRFDTIIASYCLVLPIILIMVSYWAGAWQKPLLKAGVCLSSVLVSLSFLVACADIPYFRYYETRVTVSIFQWLDSGITSLLVIFQEPSYLLALFTFIILSACFIFVQVFMYKRILRAGVSSTLARPSAARFSLYFVLMVALVYHGVKANWKSSLKANDAMLTPYSYINQLALNPTFTLYKSYSMNKKTSFMDDERAIANCRRFLGIADTCFASPLSRGVSNVTGGAKPNVVIVFMESMSAANMRYFGCPDTITPFLDSLASRSLFFDNFYSTGIHTHNAIFSTLWAHPSLSHVRQMSANSVNKFAGLPHALKERGYTNYFFITHHKQFDNMFDFIKKQDFDTLFSLEHYDKSDVINAFGVPDHVMLQRSIAEMSECHGRGKPFFATLLTTSNHLPYSLPTNIPFSPRSKSIDNKMVEYTDWAIADFMNRAKREEWFANTLFVVVGDHGQIRYRNAYDMPLSYNHVPLFIFSPSLSFRNEIVHSFGGQCDIYPTLMGLLGFSFVNNTPGVDILRTPRPHIFFSADYKIGCIDDSLFYVYRVGGKQSLYKYRGHSTVDYIDSLPGRADSMRVYAQSFLQASQLNIKNNLTGADSCRP